MIGVGGPIASCPKDWLRMAFPAVVIRRFFPSKEMRPWGGPPLLWALLLVVVTFPFDVSGVPEGMGLYLRRP